MNTDNITNTIQNHITNTVQNEVGSINTVKKLFPIIFISGVLAHITCYILLTTILKPNNGIAGIIYWFILFIALYVVYFFLSYNRNKKSLKFIPRTRVVFTIWFASTFLWILISPWILTLILTLSR